MAIRQSIQPLKTKHCRGHQYQYLQYLFITGIENSKYGKYNIKVIEKLRLILTV